MHRMQQLAFDFPLRPDFLAQVVVPRDLTSTEARRLGTFLLTIAGDAATVAHLTGDTPARGANEAAVQA